MTEGIPGEQYIGQQPYNSGAAEASQNSSELGQVDSGTEATEDTLTFNTEPEEQTEILTEEEQQQTIEYIDQYTEQLYDSMAGFRTDVEKFHEVLDNKELTDDDWVSIIEEYGSQYGVDLMSAIDCDFGTVFENVERNEIMEKLASRLTTAIENGNQEALDTACRELYIALGGSKETRKYDEGDGEVDTGKVYSTANEFAQNLILNSSDETRAKILEKYSELTGSDLISDIQRCGDISKANKDIMINQVNLAQQYVLSNDNQSSSTILKVDIDSYPLEQQNKAWTLNLMIDSLNSETSSFIEQNKEDGAVSGDFNEIKALLDIGVSSSDVTEALELQQQDMQRLTKALNGESGESFEDVFRDITGAEYNEEKIIEHQTVKGFYDFVSSEIDRAQECQKNALNSSDMQGALDAYIKYYGDEQTAVDKLNEILSSQFEGIDDNSSDSFVDYVSNVQIVKNSDTDEYETIVTRTHYESSYDENGQPISKAIEKSETKALKDCENCLGYGENSENPALTNLVDDAKDRMNEFLGQISPQSFRTEEQRQADIDEAEIFQENISNTKNMSEVFDLYKEYYGNEQKAFEELNKYLSEKSSDSESYSIVTNESTGSYELHSSKKASDTDDTIDSVLSLDSAFNCLKSVKEDNKYVKSASMTNVDILAYDYAVSKVQAFGQDRLEQVVNQYCESQDGFIDKMAAITQVTGMGLIAVGAITSMTAPPAGVAMMSVGQKMALGGMFGDNILNITDDITSNSGADSKETLAFLKETGMELGYLALGHGINDVAQFAQSGAFKAFQALGMSPESAGALSWLVEGGVDMGLSVLSDKIVIGDANTENNSRQVLMGVLTGVANAKVKTLKTQAQDMAFKKLASGEMTADEAIKSLRKVSFNDKEIAAFGELVKNLKIIPQQTDTSCAVTSVLNAIHNKPMVEQTLMQQLDYNAETGTFKINAFGETQEFTMKPGENFLQKVYDAYQTTYGADAGADYAIRVFDEVLDGASDICVKPGADNIEAIRAYSNDETSILTFSTKGDIGGLAKDHSYTVLDINADGSMRLQDPVTLQEINISKAQYEGTDSQIAGKTYSDSGLTDGSKMRLTEGLKNYIISTDEYGQQKIIYYFNDPEFVGGMLPKGEESVIDINSKLALGIGTNGKSSCILDLSDPQYKEILTGMKDGDLISIGRHPNSDIRFPQDTPGVSEQHLVIMKRGNEYIAIDNSSYGTKYLGDGSYKSSASAGNESKKTFGLFELQSLNKNEHPKLSRKLEMIEDEGVKKYIMEKFNNKHLTTQDIRELTMLSDAINAFNGKYRVIQSAENGYYHDVNQLEDLRKTGVLKETSSEDGVITQVLRGDSDIYVSDYAKGKLHEADIDLQSFLNDAKLEDLIYPMKKYLQNYPDSKIAGSLYAQYLNKVSQSLPLNLVNKMSDIENDYGVKIFASSVTLGDSFDAMKALDAIDLELAKWQQASLGQAKLPPTIDFTSACRSYLSGGNQHTGGASGGYSASRDTGAIGLKGMNEDSVHWALRHEMTHSNDLKCGENITLTNPNAKNQKLLGKLQDGKVNSKTIKDIEVPFLPYYREFKNAGISDISTIKYAYNNTREFIAVASEGDFSKYSYEFIQLLVDLGMPAWELNLK